MPYLIYVYDNYDHGESGYRAREFDDATDALTYCHKMVDDYLTSAFKPGTTAQDLWDRYTGFGDDPRIDSVGVPGVSFSAWDYAKARCEAICKASE
jgi:hypothetical protein